MDLGGTWRAYPADEELRRSFTQPGFRDDDWDHIWVPSHWRSSPGFAGSDGPVLYRRSFETAPPEPGERLWLTFDGVFYLADVWLDGSYLGATEGYFFPQTFEVTDQVRRRNEHLLAVEVACGRPREGAPRQSLTGVFQAGEELDPDWNPGGLWRPVRVERTGPTRMARLRVLCPEATAERAALDLRAVLAAAEAGEATLRTVVTDGAGRVVFERDEPHQLAAGENRVRWRIAVERPELWWPHALGAQPLYDVAVEVRQGGAASDRRRLPVGLRQIRMRRWIATINGERLFLKGANLGPTRMNLGEVRPADLAADVMFARDAGLDLLRVRGHISRPELYDAADRAGMVLWQDLPLHGPSARTLRKESVRQAREAVDLLGHHPSVVLWCGHSDPLGTRAGPMVASDARSERPSFTKTVLDGSIKRALERADPTRPAIAHSGVGVTTGDGDAHLYFGWYQGDERDLPRWLARFPRLGRFVSEFGAQAVPASDAFMSPERWPDLDWTGLARRHGLEKTVFDVRVPPAGFPTLAAWRDATQAYQAELLRRQIETIRRIKYRPAGGFCQFLLADAHPAVTCSVLDDRRVAKAGLGALAEACAPVIVVADRPEPVYEPGQAVDWDVHVVSDLRHPIERAVVSARLTTEGGEQRSWAWGGTIPADSCARVGAIRTTAPNDLGPFTVELELDAGAVKASNHYVSEVVLAP